MALKGDKNRVLLFSLLEEYRGAQQQNSAGAVRYEEMLTLSLHTHTHKERLI